MISLSCSHTSPQWLVTVLECLLIRNCIDTSNDQLTHTKRQRDDYATPLPNGKTTTFKVTQRDLLSGFSI